jgi:hypothetical protein
MKAIFFSTLLLFIAAVSFAQKFEIGVNGGAAISNVVSSKSLPEGEGTVSKEWPLIDIPSVSVKAMLTRNLWKYGISIDYSVFSYRVPRSSAIIDRVFSPGTNIDEFYEQLRKHDEATYGTKTISYIPVKLFANRTFARNKHREIYGGLSAGYIFIVKTETPQTASSSFKNNHTAGYSAGLQFGATYFVSKRIGINAEINGDYMNITSGQSNFTVITIPVTLGVRYKL